MKIAVGSTITNYQAIGKGQEIVLLHGWGCDWQIWSPIIPQLSKNHTLIIPDLPGFGQSRLDQAWDSTQYAAWLSQFLHKLEATKTVLIGHSFGGKIAALFSLEYPHLASQLIMVSSSGLPDPLTPQQKLKQDVIKLIPSPLKNAIKSSTKSKLLTSLGLSTDYALSTPLQRQIALKILHEHIGDRVSNVQIPTLLIWGENDQETPIQHAVRFNSLIPNSKLVVYKNVGHFPFIDRPTEFCADVESFITS